MDPPYCEKKREKDATQRPERNNHTHPHMYQITTNQERNQQPCNMTLILLLSVSRHDNHDTTHIKTKHTMSTTTHHSSRSTAAPMSSLPLPPHFCSAMIIVAPLFSCAIQSAAAALGLAALSYQPSIHHFPPVLPTTCPPTSLLLALLLNVVGCGFSTESHSPPLTAYTSTRAEELDISAEHDVNVAEPSNVKAPKEL